MTKTHAIGTFAAIGGLTATVALLAGLPAASADELADLRANQELLQRRIEQLAQAPNVYRGGGAGLSPLGTAASPGVAMTAGSFPRSFLIPGTDTSIRVGGAATLKLEYWLQNGPTNGNTTSAGINGRVSSQPLDIHGQTVPGLTTPGSLVPVQIEHSRGNGVWQESSRETRLNVETRTPTSWGEARTFIEMDFSNANNFNQITQLHWYRVCDMAMAHWAASSPDRPIRTSPTPTPTPRRSISAASSAKPGWCASRRCVTR